LYFGVGDEATWSDEESLILQCDGDRRCRGIGEPLDMKGMIRIQQVSFLKSYFPVERKLDIAMRVRSGEGEWKYLPALGAQEGWPFVCYPQGLHIPRRHRDWN